MTTDEKIASKTPDPRASPATTKQISAATTRAFGNLSTGRTSPHDYVYGRLKIMERKGIVQRHTEGKGTPTKWTRTTQSK